MRRFILISLAVTLVFMVTGCMHFKVLTTGYCDPNSSVQLSPESQMFVIENQQAKNPFIEKEIKTKIVTLLKKKGYQISSFDTADFYLIYSYGIGPGQTVTGHHTQTYTSQKLNVFTGQFETVPRTQTFTTRRTEHDRWLFIKVIDANEFRETRATHAIWVGETYSRGSTRDVRKIIDYLLIPTFEHFGEDTDKAVRHTMIQGDRRVKELNKATRKELDKFSSKKRVTREATVRPEPNYSARTQVTAGERVYPDCDLKIRELLTAGEDVALCI